MSVQDEQPLDEFDPEVHADVEGLLHLGALQADVEFGGHTWGLRTLRPAEEIAAAAVIERYRSTLKEPEAWVCAQVAAALTHIDGVDVDEAIPPVGPDLVEKIRGRYRYVTENWYWPVVNHLFIHYARLLERQVTAINAVQDFSPRGPAIFSPAPDSLTEQGTSRELRPMDTLR